MADARFLKLWNKVVFRVHTFATDPSSRTQGNFLGFEAGLLNECMLPQVLPPATTKAWSTLVQDMKVNVHMNAITSDATCSPAPCKIMGHNALDAGRQ